MATMKTLNGYGFNATELNGKNSDSYLQLGDDAAGSTGEAPALNAGTFGGMTVSQFIDMIYPVGSIYMSVSNTSPETLFGGTWEQIKDRFLLALIVPTRLAARAARRKTPSMRIISRQKSHSSIRIILGHLEAVELWPVQYTRMAKTLVTHGSEQV